MSKKKLIIIIIVVLVIGGEGLLLLRKAILGGTTNLGPSQNSLGSQVAKSLGNANSSTASPTLPVEDKDFSIDSTKYFDNNTWVLVHVVPVTPNAAEPAYIIMHKQNNTYQTVLGPGSDFPSNTLQGVPSDIVKYLTSLGFVSQPASQ